MPIKRFAFFFGSGISYGSEMPSVGQITEELLEKPWKSHTNRGFYPCKPHEGSKSLGEAKPAQDFLRLIKENIDDHLKSRIGRESNYEDLYSVASQIFDNEMDELVNPLLEDSIEKIKNASAHIWLNIRYSHVYKNSFASLANRSSDLIQWVVLHSLTQKETPIGLDIVGNMATHVDVLNVFSLNHDLLLETQFRNQSIPFADGFSGSSGNLKVFNWSWNDAKVCLLKLHGSINWQLFRFKEYDQYAKVEKISDYARDEEGNVMLPLDSAPKFLTGTSVKEASYGTGLYGEIFTEFRRRLSNHTTLVCSGYGWGDKGINIRLNQWLRDRKENRIIILQHGNEVELSRKPFWYWKWGKYVKSNKVILIPKWLSECSIADLEPYIES